MKIENKSNERERERGREKALRRVRDSSERERCFQTTYCFKEQKKKLYKKFKCGNKREDLSKKWK